MDSKENQGMPVRDAYRDHLYKTFRRYLVESPIVRGQLPRDSQGILKVLSVGCSFAYEAKPLVDLFPNTHYKGIDFPSARAGMLTNSDIPVGSAEFAGEDARLLDEQEKEKYGLVVIRHPQVAGTLGEITQEDMQTIKSSTELKVVPYWQDIIRASIHKIAKDGYIVVTTDTPTEQERTARFLQQNGITIFEEGENKASTISGPHRDSIIIVGQKTAVE